MGFNSWGSPPLKCRVDSFGTWTQLLWSMWDLPRPGIKPVSRTLVADSLPLSHLGSPESHLLKSGGLLNDLTYLSFSFPKSVNPGTTGGVGHRHRLTQLKDNQGLSCYREQLWPGSKDLCWAAVVLAMETTVSSRVKMFEVIFPFTVNPNWKSRALTKDVNLDPWMPPGSSFLTRQCTGQGDSINEMSSFLCPQS